MKLRTLGTLLFLLFFVSLTFSLGHLDNRRVDNTPEEGFDIVSEIEGTEYEQHAEVFLNVFNSKMLEAQKIKVKHEAEVRDRLSRGGWSSRFWGFIAALLSPVKLLIIAAILCFMPSRVGLISASLSAALISEMLLTSSQLLRTFGEGFHIHLIASFVIAGSLYLLIMNSKWLTKPT